MSTALGLGTADQRAIRDVKLKILISKVLAFEDFRIRYGGAIVGLVGSAIADDSLEPNPGLVIPYSIGIERRSRVLELVGAFMDAPRGYVRDEDAYRMLRSALPGWKSVPLSFLAFNRHEDRVVAFLDRVEREALLD